MSRLAGLGAAALAVVAACSSNNSEGTGPTDPAGSGSGSAAAPPTELVVVDAAGATAHKGTKVGVRGKTEDAKLGAVLVTSADLVVYCLGVESWGPDRGVELTARGTLEQTDEFSSTTGPNGEISAGTSGSVWVLRGCTYDPTP